MEPVDAKGDTLQVNDLVVFNQSGNLNSGVIVRITPKRLSDWNKHWPSYLHYIVRIAYAGNAVAKVENTQGIWKL